MMSRRGLIDIVMSRDRDMIVQGVRNVLLEWNFADRTCEVFHAELLNKYSGSDPLCLLLSPLAMDQRLAVLRLLAQFCGCDYTKIKGVAAGKAVALLLHDDVRKHLQPTTFQIDAAVAEACEQCWVSLTSAGGSAAMSARHCTINDAPVKSLAAFRKLVVQGMMAFAHGPAFCFTNQTVMLLSDHVQRPALSSSQLFSTSAAVGSQATKAANLRQNLGINALTMSQEELLGIDLQASDSEPLCHRDRRDRDRGDRDRQWKFQTCSPELRCCTLSILS
jgi:hypothetical protein